MDTLSQKYKLLFSLKNAVCKGYGFSMTVTRNEAATQKTLNFRMSSIFPGLDIKKLAIVGKMF